MPEVSIIIPAWNLWGMTKNCLESLAKYTGKDEIEVIVVDNCSSDETATELSILGHNLFTENFKALRLEKNFGFAIACNAGAKAASGDFLFFLNNDTLVTENWLAPLLTALKSSSMLGMVSPLLLYPNTLRVQHCGVVFEPTLVVRHLYENFPPKHPAVQKNRHFQALSGAAILISKNLFLQCGSFYEGYLNGFEDLDLSCAIRKKNLFLTCIAKSTIIHLTSQTPGRNDYDAQNAKLINERHPGACSPDMHLKIIEDGFIPKLSPTLDIYFSATLEKEQALNTAFNTNFSAERCLKRLETEPVWEYGYELLANYFESNKELSHALNIRTMQTAFFPFAKNIKALGNIALKNNDLQGAKTAFAAYENILAEIKDKTNLLDKASGIINWAKKANDLTIENLYTQWIVANK